MKHYSGALKRVVLVLMLLLIGCGSAMAKSVLFSLKDQNNNLIDKTLFYINGIGNIENNTLVELPEGDYTLKIKPGINGNSGSNVLYRTEEITVNDTYQGQYTWNTKTVLVSVQNQDNIELQSSFVIVKGLIGTFANGSSMFLPITNNNVYPTLQGTFADGYDFTIVPGLNGKAISAYLTRDETIEVVDNSPVRFEWITKAVSVHIHDQENKSIPGSFLVIKMVPGVFKNGDTLTVPITDNAVYSQLKGVYAKGYDVSVVPGLNGKPISAYLSRGETVEFDDNTSGSFEWITKTVFVNIHDQDNNTIPGSFLTIKMVPGVFKNGDTLMLPITNNAVYSQLKGVYAKGYDVSVVPGLNGKPISAYLRRGEIVEFDDNTSGSFEWITKTVFVNIHDQDNNAISGSFLTIKMVPGVFKNGDTLVLPITDNALYGLLRGVFSSGYEMKVTPGINGNANSAYLYRKDKVEFHNETDGGFEWIVASGNLFVVGEDGLSEVSESMIKLHTSVISSMESVTLPITNNSMYSTIAGIYSDGYDLFVKPGDASGASAIFPFEVNEDKSIVPLFVNINTSLYGLRFNINNRPSIDVNEAIMIQSEEQATVILTAFATDIDGDLLTYEWFLGENRIVENSSVGDDGAIALSLNSIDRLSIGQHEFTVVVSDGIESIEKRIMVTIENSPPDVVTSGSGISEVGSYVNISAHISDYDGDIIDYSWLRDGEIISQSTIATIVEGEPVKIPDVELLFNEVGIYELSLLVSDGQNDAQLENVSIQIVDGTAPILMPVANKNILWPPNHKMQEIVIETNASDNSGKIPFLSVDVFCSEPPETNRNGEIIPNYTEPVIDTATGAVVLNLRSERSGKGNGREYTVIISATDESNNASQVELLVVAPHDKGKK